MTKEQILAIDLNFQNLIDLVVRNNTSGTYKYWHEVWVTVKNMNTQLEICGWDAQDERLRTHTAYNDMQRILEGMTTLK